MHDGKGLDRAAALGQLGKAGFGHRIDLLLIDLRILRCKGLLRRLGAVDASRVLGHIVAVGGDQPERPRLGTHPVHHFGDRMGDIVVARPTKKRQTTGHGQAARIVG